MHGERKSRSLVDHRREILHVAAGLEREGVPKLKAQRRARSLVNGGYAIRRGPKGA